MSTVPKILNIIVIFYNFCNFKRYYTLYRKLLQTNNPFGYCGLVIVGHYDRQGLIIYQPSFVFENLFRSRSSHLSQSQYAIRLDKWPYGRYILGMLLSVVWHTNYLLLFKSSVFGFRNAPWSHLARRGQIKCSRSKTPLVLIAV